MDFVPSVLDEDLLALDHPLVVQPVVSLVASYLVLLDVLVVLLLSLEDELAVQFLLPSHQTQRYQVGPFLEYLVAVPLMVGRQCTECCHLLGLPSF